MKRNLSRMFRTGVAAAAALLCAMPFQAAAEDYPSRPITLIMPFGAGNAPDTAARIIGDYLQRKHNITLLITSKPGGSAIAPKAPATPTRNTTAYSRKPLAQPSAAASASRLGRLSSLAAALTPAPTCAPTSLTKPRPR